MTRGTVFFREASSAMGGGGGVTVVVNKYRETQVKQNNKMFSEQYKRSKPCQ
ncbi:hypothetical protein O9929_13260 [Vibrio lentus]|nr:hypothetical protein [Vibrio lentus]